jgi:hypothetical protein
MTYARYVEVRDKSRNRSIMTKGELLAAMEGMPDDTHLEIHVPPNREGFEDVNADFEIGAVGVVQGSHDPQWFNIAVGEFITNCGG